MSPILSPPGQCLPAAPTTQALSHEKRLRQGAPGPYRLLVERLTRRAAEENREALRAFDEAGAGAGGTPSRSRAKPDEPVRRATFVCLAGSVAMEQVAGAARSVLLASGARLGPALPAAAAAAPCPTVQCAQQRRCSLLL